MTSLDGGRCSSPSRASTARANRHRQSFCGRGSRRTEKRSSPRVSPAGPSSASRSASSSFMVATSNRGQRRSLYAAARAQHVEQVIQLRSSEARRSSAIATSTPRSRTKGVGREGSAPACARPQPGRGGGALAGPDPPLAVRSRRGLGASRQGHDRLEREDEAFHRRVDAGYRGLAERFPERIVMLDGERPPEQIAEEVHGALRVSA